MSKLKFSRASVHDYRLVGTGCIVLSDAAFSVGADNIVGGYGFKIIGYDPEQRLLTLEPNIGMGKFAPGQNIYIAPSQADAKSPQIAKIVEVDEQAKTLTLDDELQFAGNVVISPESPAAGMVEYLRGTTSFATGFRNIATGAYSYAGGLQNIALRVCQDVRGRYNQPDNYGADGNADGHYISIWGNGTSGNRSNAAALTWGGHIISSATAAPADGQLWNGSFSIFDDAGTLKFKRKAANGSVSTITVGTGGGDPGEHNHDGVYALIDHNHSGIYADLVAGKIPANQLPSFVDDVLEYANLAAFPALGESGKIYLAIDTNKSYRWSGSVYVEITGGGVVLGETESTAGRGDHALTAYNHSQEAHAPSNATAAGAAGDAHAGTSHAPANAQKNSDITKEEIEAKLTGPISSHSHAGGGGGGGLTVEEVTTDTAIANGKLYIASSANMLNFTLPATFAQGFTFGIIAKELGGIQIKSGAAGQLITTSAGNLIASDSDGDVIAQNFMKNEYMEFICETANAQVYSKFTSSIKNPSQIIQINTSQLWIVPAGVTMLDHVYVIAGGGAGGSSTAQRAAGGGGGGGVIHLTNVSVTPEGEIMVMIGAGGAAVDGSGSNGGDTILGDYSTFGEYTAIGGGGGGAISSTVGSGGSGGGGSNMSGGSGTSGQGYNGGSDGVGGGNGGGGGGGGAGGVGESTTTGAGGNGGGGINLLQYIGASYGDNGSFAGGGGGGTAGADMPAGSATCGGGRGGDQLADAQPGTANSGGGGGGEGGIYGVWTGTNGRDGGSGTIIIIIN